MWEVHKPTKLFKERLKYMGDDYSDKVIDMEHCIYRALPNGVDFEISGANNNRKKYVSMSIYVWCRHESSFIMEQKHEIKTMTALKSAMEDFIVKYTPYTPDDLAKVKDDLYNQRTKKGFSG